MQHGDLDKTKVLKTQRDSKSDVWKPNSMSVLKSILPVRLVLHISHTGWTCPRESLIHRTCPITLCPVLDQTSLVNNMTIGI
jgi:hypothetical protein